MDFKIFYGVDIVNWINQANHMSVQHGIDSETFWTWVAESAGAICVKYGDHPLVIKQMICSTEWLEEVYETRKGA